MKPTTNKISRVIKLLLGVFLLILVCRGTWALFSMDYHEYYKYFIRLVYAKSLIVYIDNPALVFLFYGLRIAFSAVVLFLGFRIYSILAHNNILLHKKEEPFFKSIAISVEQNAVYIKRLGKYNIIILCTILFIQLSAFTYLIVALPYHTDEAFSYLYFSGKGLISTLTYYPQPNNHVFYNIISGFMLALPIDPFVAIRLPNLLIGILCTFYFLKTANKLLSVKLSLLITTLFIFSFPFIFYSFQARGYQFTLFFSLMVFYAFVNIVEGKNLKKYLNLYTVCCVLGFFTIPTFLYFILPVGIFMFFIFLQKKKYKVADFIKANVLIVLFTCLLYLPIMLRNGWDALTSARGVATIRSFEYVKANIILHLTGTWAFLVATNAIPLLIIIPLVLLLLIIAYKETGYKRSSILLMAIMLVSPLFIIFLHKVIPFFRTWNYILIPLALGIGIILNILLPVFNINKLRSHAKTLIAVGLIIIWAGIMIPRSEKLHHNMLDVDFVVRDYVILLKEKLPSISRIDRPDDGSFYLGEDLQAELLKRGKEVELVTVSFADSLSGDLFVSEKNTIFFVPDTYELVPFENPYFKVYIRKGL